MSDSPLAAMIAAVRASIDLNTPQYIGHNDDLRAAQRVLEALAEDPLPDDVQRAGIEAAFRRTSVADIWRVMLAALLAQVAGG